MSVDLLLGNAMELLEGFPDETFDCVFVDPPYAQTELKWDKRVHAWPAQVRRVLKRSGSMWVFGSLRSFMASAEDFKGWKLAQDIVWEKQNGSGFDTQRFRRVHEQAAMFYRDDAPWSGVYRNPQFTYDATARKLTAKSSRVPHAGRIGPHVYESVAGGPRMMRSVLKVRNCHRQGFGHGTPKPEGIVEPLILYSCPPGGRVLDPFAGSGVTGVVAAKHGFDCTLIELLPEHVAIAAKRLGFAA